MRLYNPKSKSGAHNVLLDFIMLKVSENNKFTTLLELINVGNFLVVKGETNNPTKVLLSKTYDEFLDWFPEYSNIFPTNFIDCINYDADKIDIISPYLWNRFYKTERPLFSDFQVDIWNEYDGQSKFNYVDENYVHLEFGSIKPSKFTPLTVQSISPFGLSLDLRAPYYYSEMVANNMMEFAMVKDMEVCLVLSVLDDLPEIMIKTNSPYSNDKLSSCAMDIFDISLPEFIELIKDHNVMDDSLFPLHEKTWNKINKKKELVIF